MGESRRRKISGETQPKGDGFKARVGSRYIRFYETVRFGPGSKIKTRRGAYEVGPDGAWRRA